MAKKKTKGQHGSALEVRESREDKLIQLLGEYDWPEAAIMAGYTASYADSIERQKLRSKRFVTKLINAGEQAKAAVKPRSQLQYAKALGARGKIIIKACKDPEYAESNAMLVTKMFEAAARDAGLRTAQVEMRHGVDVGTMHAVQAVLRKEIEEKEVEERTGRVDAIEAEFTETPKLLESEEAKNVREDTDTSAANSE